MGQTVDTHHRMAPRSVRCAVLTVSDTRTLATDTGGRLVVELLTAAGHMVVAREIIPDEPAVMRAILNKFHPFKQVRNRLISLRLTGHEISKNELIVLFG